MLAVFSRAIISIAFGNDYASNYYWIYPLLLWVIFSIKNNFLGIQTYLGSGHDKEYGFIFEISLCITILVIFICIKLKLRT